MAITVTALHRGFYLLGRRRAQAKAKRELADIVADTENRLRAYDEHVDAELRALKSEAMRMDAIESAIDVERDEARWLH